MYRQARRSKTGCEIEMMFTLRDASLAALLLTGTNEGAEQAVSEAIATMDCGGSVDELLVATAKFAIQLRDERSSRAAMPSSLPPELQRLFLLSSLGRDCFVLRMLMGISAEMSSEILEVDRDEVDEAMCRALSELAGLEGIQNAQTTAMECSVEGGDASSPSLIH
jgi:hypothetical protein